MGFLADNVAGAGGSAVLSRGGGASLWQEVFGRATDKEAAHPAPPQPTAQSASLRRLLDALRSRAPGGWTDDRLEQTRNNTGHVFVASDRIGKQLGQAEFQVYKRDPSHPDGRRPVTPDDPPDGDRTALNIRPYDLVRLLQRPNDQDGFGMMMRRLSQQQILTGMALNWMVPSRAGVPMRLYVMPTAMMVPQPVTNAEYPEGYYRVQPYYPYGPFSTYPGLASSAGAAIPAQWVLKFIDPHPLLRYEGYSALTGLSQQIDAARMIDLSRSYKMRRSFNPTAVLQMDQADGLQALPPEEIDRILAQFEAAQQGPENHGTLFVTAPGTKLEEFGSRPVDMEYQSGWDQLTSFIMGGGFGITKPAAGMIEDANYAALFATLKQLNLVTLQPYCDYVAGEFTRHLAPFFGDDLIVEIRCKRIDDHEVRGVALDRLIKGKAITKNELRRELDMPPTEEPWGDDIAGDPSPVMQQQLQAGANPPGDPGRPAGALGGGRDALPPPGAAYADEPRELALDRPRAGDPGRGSKGPRAPAPLEGRSKSLPARSVYDLTREVMRNGAGRRA